MFILFHFYFGIYLLHISCENEKKKVSLKNENNQPSMLIGRMRCETVPHQHQTYGIALYTRLHSISPRVMVAVHWSAVKVRTMVDGLSPPCFCVNVSPSSVHTLFTLRPSMVSSSNSSPNLKAIFVFLNVDSVVSVNVSPSLAK